MSDTTDALLDNLRAKLNGAGDDLIKLELFNTVDEVARESLRVTAPADVDADPDTWLASEALWIANYQAILHGTLYRMYAQLGKPWSNADLAAAHRELYSIYLDQTRTEAADDPATAYARLVNAIRVQLPFVRDAGIKLELFNTVNKVRLEAYLTTALAGTETDPTTWLTAAQYGQAYPALYHGTLARLYAQPSKPWADGTAYEIHNNQYVAELDLIRGTTHAEQDVALERLMNDLRIRLPGARDESIKQELFSAADEFFKISGVWREEVDFSVNTTNLTYDIESEESFAQVHRLLKVVNGDDVAVYATMAVPPEVTFKNYPSEDATWTATIMLTIGQHVDSDGFPVIPTWLLEQYRESFLDGVLGRMMSQVAKPYTNERMSTYHLRRFRNAIAQARKDAQQTLLFGAQNWNYPRGWR